MLLVRELLVYLVVLPLFLNGCDSSTPSSTDQLPQVITPPPVGSVFVFENWDIDSLGIKVASSQMTLTDSIVQSGITFEGKKNVIEYVARYSNGVSIPGNYLSIESTGDVSVWSPVYALQGTKYVWVRYPFHTISTIEVTLLDTTVSSGGSSTSVKQIVTLSNEGFQNVTVADTTVRAPKVKSVAVSTVVKDGKQQQFTARSFDAFSPSIAFWSYQYIEPTKYTNDQTINGNLSTLVSYTLKK